MDDLERRLPALPAHIRTATRDDLVPAAKVYQAAARSLNERIRAVNPVGSAAARDRDLQEAVRVLTDLSHRRDGAVIVAEVFGDLAGVGAVRIQDRHAHIAFLFVLPAFQGQSLGRQLLDRLASVASDAGADTMSLVASRDPRAWQRYLRLGLRPGPPILSMRATKPRFPSEEPDAGLTIEPLTPDSSGDLDIVDEMDLAIRGSRRRSDVEAWLCGGDTGALLIDPKSRSPTGYVIIGREPDHVRIGPVVARTVARFPDVLAHALHLAGTLDGATRHPWRIDFPSINQVAIAPLLEAGFIVTALQPWFASSEIGQWDRYIFRTEDEL
jgi:GNAT superfamily N-acetyltransferase